MAKKLHSLFYLAFIILLSSCKYYTFSGIDVNPKIKTFSVDQFDNLATIVNPDLSINLKQNLIDKLNRKTEILEQEEEGDLHFYGSVDRYDVVPIGISSEAKANESRFTIQVKVSYFNIVEPATNFTSAFTAFRDFDNSTSFDSVEDELTEEMIEELSEKIFNKALVNW